MRAGEEERLTSGRDPAKSRRNKKCGGEARDHDCRKGIRRHPARAGLGGPEMKRSHAIAGMIFALALAAAIVAVHLGLVRMGMLR
jgi:hypothetical protein